MIKLDKISKFSGNIIFAICAAITAILLSVIQTPFELHWLSWAALVPLVIGLHIAKPGKWPLITSYLILSCFWIVNLYWIGYVTVPGWITFGFFSGIYWPFSIAGLWWANKKKIPLFISLSIMVVGAEAWQGILLTGFDWYLLGHSQYRNLKLIQICDILGVAGVSWLIAMVNGLVSDAALQAVRLKKYSKLLLPQAIITGLLITSAVVYGQFRLKQTPESLGEGPLIGVVQPSVPSEMKQNYEMGEQILQVLIDQSQSCIEAGPKFVIWPETMVMGTVNIEYLRYLLPEERGWKLSNMISEFAFENKCYILAGALSASVGKIDDRLAVTNQHNSALMYKPNGEQQLERYDKIHLVPFGEYVPFHEFALVKKLMMFFTPYDYDYSLTAGTSYTVFKPIIDGKQYRASALICYEDTDADVVRKLALPPGSDQKVHWIASLSNDGWYVRKKKGKVVPSIELPQRTAISIFRSIENRVAILRSVNTGISCMIDTTGSLVDGYSHGNLPENVMERQVVAGWFADIVPIDKRVTFFSKYGMVLNKICCPIATVMFIAGLLGLRRQKKEKANEQA